MSTAKVIKFSADNQVVTPDAPAKTSFTRLDNATDMALLYELPNALLKPALALMEYRNLRALHWGEIATITGKGATVTRAALKQLADLGFAVVEGDCWAWIGSAASRKSARKPVRKSENSQPLNTVSDEVFQAPKELKEVKELKNNNIPTKPMPVPASVVGGEPISENSEPVQTQEGLAPDGAASGEAKPVNLSLSQGKNTDQDGEKLNVKALENVPPAAPLPAAELAAPADPIPAARTALEAADLYPVWERWFAANPNLARNRVALEAQICQFAEWAASGLGDALRREALDIVSAGSFAHPFNALRPRMVRAKAVQQAQAANAAETRRAFGEPQCKVGERRRAPDGAVWTVEEVAYGTVIFEEIGAPHNIADSVVALWEVLA